jgi:alkylhydroperoxidase/carboxymuconolactone decarboxylase family protein YurZ
MPQLRDALTDGLNAGLSVNQIKEILVQMYAYAGFPRSLNALGVLMALLEQRRTDSITDPAGDEPKTLPASTNMFLKTHLFGDIFSRDNLDWQSREIATVAALATLDGLENQLQSHFRIALNTGLAETHLRGLITVLCTRIGHDQGDRAAEILDKVLAGRGA